MEVENASTQYPTISDLLRRHAFSHVTVVQNEEQAAGDIGIIYASR